MTREDIRWTGMIRSWLCPSDGNTESYKETSSAANLGFVTVPVIDVDDRYRDVFIPSFISKDKTLDRIAPSTGSIMYEILVKDLRDWGSTLYRLCNCSESGYYNVKDMGDYFINNGLIMTGKRKILVLAGNVIRFEEKMHERDSSILYSVCFVNPELFDMRYDKENPDRKMAVFLTGKFLKYIKDICTVRLFNPDIFHVKIPRPSDIDSEKNDIKGLAEMVADTFALI